MTIPGNPPPRRKSTSTYGKFPTDITRQTYVAVQESTRVDRGVHKMIPAVPQSSEGDEITTDSMHYATKGTKYNLVSNLAYMYHSFFPVTYQVGANYGVNTHKARKQDICLAKYAFETANDMKTVGNCYTGVKYAFWNAGIINDYADMPPGSAKDSIPYFRSHPDQFEEVHCSKESLRFLPAGHIIVYTKEGHDGHIAITNGNGQEMSDSTDNMAWLVDKGEGASFVVFKLTDKWKYNKTTKKLEFKQPMLDSNLNVPKYKGLEPNFIA